LITFQLLITVSLLIIVDHRLTVSLLITVFLSRQNWVLGLLRAPSFQWVSGQWHQFMIEPLVVPVVKQGCYIQYHRLFSDVATGDVYLEFWAGNWMQLFKMQSFGGALPIVAAPPLI
jgi:hypothetical protein